MAQALNGSHRKKTKIFQKPGLNGIDGHMDATDEKTARVHGGLALRPSLVVRTSTISREKTVEQKTHCKVEIQERSLNKLKPSAKLFANLLSEFSICSIPWCYTQIICSIVVLPLVANQLTLPKCKN